ncbi:MAG: hypothetical protein M1826_001115 [Phylliscum demangeonii]|nr:MAG: hypothetical protein M1826_001115 [Phylliscum demangeonii]
MSSSTERPRRASAEDRASQLRDDADVPVLRLAFNPFDALDTPPVNPYWEAYYLPITDEVFPRRLNGEGQTAHAQWLGRALWAASAHLSTVRPTGPRTIGIGFTWPQVNQARDALLNFNHFCQLVKVWGPHHPQSSWNPWARPGSARARLPIPAMLHLNERAPDIRGASNAADAPIVQDDESENARKAAALFDLSADRAEDVASSPRRKRFDSALLAAFAPDPMLPRLPTPRLGPYNQDEILATPAAIPATGYLLREQVLSEISIPAVLDGASPSGDPAADPAADDAARPSLLVSADPLIPPTQPSLSTSTVPMHEDPGNNEMEEVSIIEESVLATPTICGQPCLVTLVGPAHILQRWRAHPSPLLGPAHPASPEPWVQVWMAMAVTVPQMGPAKGMPIGYQTAERHLQFFVDCSRVAGLSELRRLMQLSRAWKPSAWAAGPLEWPPATMRLNLARAVVGARWVLVQEGLDYFKAIKRQVRLVDVYRSYLAFQAEVTNEELLVNPASARGRPSTKRCALPLPPKAANPGEGERPRTDHSAPRGAVRHELREYVVAQADVIVTTCSNAAEGFITRSCHPDVLFVDEAARPVELDLVIPIAFYGPRIVVLVGDEKQLRPTVKTYGKKSSDKKAINCFASQLAISIFDRLKTSGYPTVLLREQHRMTAGLAKAASDIIYDGQLIDAPSTALVNRIKSQSFLVWTSTNHPEIRARPAMPPADPTTPPPPPPSVIVPGLVSPHLLPHNVRAAPRSYFDEEMSRIGFEGVITGLSAAQGAFDGPKVVGMIEPRRPWSAA